MGTVGRYIRYEWQQRLMARFLLDFPIYAVYLEINDDDSTITLERGDEAFDERLIITSSSVIYVLEQHPDYLPVERATVVYDGKELKIVEEFKGFKVPEWLLNP
ncbi:hypothetical protein [Thermus phage P23-45]|uniref:Uncharacterized protein n=1 Tax=Thermus virus P23-45 TaxID=2914006 RepID=A7XX99_BP234|nr:hypothetical protein P23p69 [Thermus phage P23-45]ABU96902.1 hypothetical protein P23p69 [Thermus phage P23-45]UYB98405.1 hypothetical protein [Thermus phage P23-45]